MSYINAMSINDEVLVWERTDKGRDIKIFQAPFYFYEKHPHGEYTSIYGDNLKRHDFSSRKEFNLAKKQALQENRELFESDIPPELRILSERYYGVEAPKLNITNYDIEVDYNPDIGFSSPQNPYAPINSVALHHDWKKQYIVLAVPPNLSPFNPTDDDFVPGDAPDEFVEQMHTIAALPDDIELIVKFFKNEKELLVHMLYELEDSDAVVGWNNETFDWPYIGKRIELTLGRTHFNKMSFDSIKTPKWREEESSFGGTILLLDTFGRLNVDYMKLFQKYEMAERPSYKLEAIADEFLGNDLPKLEYEGSLAQLYRGEWKPNPNNPPPNEEEWDNLTKWSVYRERLRKEIKKRGLDHKI